MFLPFFGLFYVLKTASFQRFLDITGVAVICGHAAVTLRSRVTATRKFEIVGKWRFLCYEHVTRVLIRVKGVYFACFWHRANGIYVDFVESHIVRQPYPFTGFCIARIMRAFPLSDSRSNVHDLRPLRSFLSVAAFPFSPPLPGENRPTLMVAGAAMRAARSARTVGGRHASDTRETPVRDTYSLLFPPRSPRPCDTPAALRRATPTIQRSVH